SAMATSLTVLSAVSASLAAPVPRPPQPMRPILMMSLPAAWTSGALVKVTAAAAPATAPVVKKSRRVGCERVVRFCMRYSSGEKMKMQIRSIAPFRGLGLQTFKILLFLPRADDGEADEIGLGHPPDALRFLGVVPLPPQARAAAGGAAALAGVVGPGAAADHLRITGRAGEEDGPPGGFHHRELRGIVGLVVIQTPLRDVAVYVVQSPRVGFLGADLVRGVVGVVPIPGVIAELVDMVAEEISR